MEILKEGIKEERELLRAGVPREILQIAIKRKKIHETRGVSPDIGRASEGIRKTAQGARYPLYPSGGKGKARSDEEVPHTSP
ncbi:MAG: hypothetical protein Q9N34_02990 [Aquificota bacterium]|nr:hypothetical protein [Aquificota bacterium]